MTVNLTPQFVNLTPHAINIRVGLREICVPPSGKVARVAQAPTAPATPVFVEELEIPVVASPKFEGVVDLPDPAPNTMFLVSGLVLGHVVGRNDVFAPATGPQDEAVRNEKGHIVAVTRLVRAA